MEVEKHSSAPPSDVNSVRDSWLQSMLVPGTERISPHVTCRGIWDVCLHAQAGPGEHKTMFVPRFTAKRGESNAALRRVYPHFVRSGVKVKQVLVGGVQVRLAEGGIGFSAQ